MSSSLTNPTRSIAGSFILALGQTLGAAGKGADAFFANLFQQTPMDKFFGDLMAASDFTGFLLEFKRDWNGRLTERKKEKFKIINNDQQLVERAKKCHLPGYGVGQPGMRNLNLRFGSYTEIVHAEEPNQVKDVWDLTCFLKGVIDHQIGGSSKEFRDYLNHLFSAFTEYFERLVRFSQKFSKTLKLGAPNPFVN